MTLAKAWNGSAWIPVNGLVGPPGPQGPAGPGSEPNGAAGPAYGVLTGTYPNPTNDKTSPLATHGQLIAVQRNWGGGNSSAYKAITNGQNFTTDAAGTLPLRVSYSPVGDCEWDTECCVGILQKTDAAYHYAYLTLTLAPADAFGDSYVQMIYTQHSTVQTYCYRSASKVWRLYGGMSYTLTASIATNGGTWQYHQYYPYLWISGRAFNPGG